MLQKISKKYFSNFGLHEKRTCVIDCYLDILLSPEPRRLYGPPSLSLRLKSDYSLIITDHAKELRI